MSLVCNSSVTGLIGGLCQASNLTRINITSQDNKRNLTSLEEEKEKAVVWVPYLGVVFFAGCVVVLSLSFYSRYTRAKQRRQSHMDYIERNIDLKRTRLHCIMRMPAKLSAEDYFTLVKAEGEEPVVPNGQTNHAYGDNTYPPNRSVNLSTSLHSFHDFSDTHMHTQEAPHRPVSIHALHPSQVPERLLRREDFPGNTSRHRDEPGWLSQCQHCRCCCHRHPDRPFLHQDTADTSIDKEDEEVLNKALQARRRHLSELMQKRRATSLARTLKREKRIIIDDTEPTPLKSKGAKSAKSDAYRVTAGLGDNESHLKNLSPKKMSIDVTDSYRRPGSFESKAFVYIGAHGVSTSGQCRGTQSAVPESPESVVDSSESPVEDIYISPSMKGRRDQQSDCISSHSTRDKKTVPTYSASTRKDKNISNQKIFNFEKSSTFDESESSHPNTPLTGFTNYAFDNDPSDIDAPRECSPVARPDSEGPRSPRITTSFPRFTPSPL